jgi:hypothetical protein
MPRTVCPGGMGNIGSPDGVDRVAAGGALRCGGQGHRCRCVHDEAGCHCRVRSHRHQPGRGHGSHYFGGQVGQVDSLRVTWEVLEPKMYSRQSNGDGVRRYPGVKPACSDGYFQQVHEGGGVREDSPCHSLLDMNSRVIVE